jgi:hypothetical protein
VKKIIALLLVLTLTFFATACGEEDGGPDYVAEINRMYSVSVPTKSVSVVKYEFASYTLTDKTTVVSGKVDGTLTAAVMTEETQRLQTVEDGSGIEIIDFIKTEVKVTEYLEGKGTRVNRKGRWDAEGQNFAFVAGSIAIAITNDNVNDVKKVGNTYTFVVTAANTAAVFGEAIPSSVEVTVTHDGASVVGLKLSYVVAANAESSTPETTVTVDIVYSYDIEKINIG